MDFKDKVALITGASSGIGAELTLALAAQGCHLALSARRPEALEAVAERARARGVTARVYPCDTQEHEQVNAAVRRVLSDFEKVDLLILSAGIAGDPTAPFDAQSAEGVLRTNLLGAVYWIAALLPAMRARGRGTIVGLSSLASARGLPGAGAYSASKAGLSTLLESLRVDLRPEGIRVITVEPGYVRTPMTAKNRSMPFLVEAERAACLILRGVQRDQRLIRFPRPMAWLVGLMRALPAPLYDRVATHLRR